MPAQHRYETLDALRGIAALAVLVFHLGQMNLIPELVPHGYLAVDFFFVLSGFVVAHAYEQALRGPLSFQAFVRRRMIRLYPLAILGAALGAALLLLKWRFYPEKVDPLPSILISGVLNALLLPTPFGGEASRHVLFPGNGPLWSLFFELAVNLVWAAWGTRLRTRTLLAIVAIAGFAVAVLSWQAGTANIGFDMPTALAGVARVSFGFPLGVVFFRLFAAAKWLNYLRFDRIGAIILAILLLAILAMPNATPSSFVAWDIASVLVLLPILVLAGVAQDGGGRFGNLLGELSYPLYVLHFPVLLVFSGLHQSALAHVPASVMAGAAVISAITVALLALRFYDVPLRGWLSRRARRRAESSKAEFSAGEAPL